MCTVHPLVLIHLCQGVREIEQEGLSLEATEEEQLGLRELNGGKAETLIKVWIVRDLQEAPALVLEVSRVWALPEEAKVKELNGVPGIFLHAGEDIYVSVSNTACSSTRPRPIHRCKLMP